MIFPNQSMRSFYPNLPLLAQYQGMGAAMPQFSQMTQPRDMMMMNNLFSNLQKMNQANMMNQDFSTMLTQQMSNMNPTLKAPSTCASDSGAEEASYQQNKRRLNIKCDSEFEENLQKKLKSSNGSSHIVHKKDVESNKTNKVQRKMKSAAEKSLIGSYENEDKPLSISAFKFDENGSLAYQVEWKMRSDGTQPKSCFVSRNALLKNDPILVATYYENQILSVKDNFVSN